MSDDDAAHGFDLDHLPVGAVVDAGGAPRAVVRLGTSLLDLARLDAELFADGTLDALLAAGPARWADIRGRATDALTADSHPLLALADVRPVLAFTPADYVDFYASIDHATNAGRIFRPDAPEPLTPNWRHLPIGYHGRSASLQVSGTDVVRPSGLLGPGSAGPSQALDYEAELAFVVGRPGTRIPVADADEHVFGVCLLNDWSARDIQRFEAQPLGPFLGKSFATSVSAWITPLAALAERRCPEPRQDPPPVAHLREAGAPHGLDLTVRVSINGMTVSETGYAGMYWTWAQMLAHLSANGARVRTGDVFASGTISGPRVDQGGCLLELTRNGTRALALPDGTERCWLLDGDEVLIEARGGSLTLGEVRGLVRSG